MSTYSPDLRIELITTGDQAGTWGTTTNTNLGTIIEDAISGYVSVSVTSANQAFTALNGAADEARNAMIRLTTTTGAAFAVYAPPVSKQYIIWNNSGQAATIYNSTVIGNTTAAGTGVAIANGDKVVVFSDGTSFYEIKTANVTGTVAIANGGTGQTTANAAFNALAPSQATANGKYLKSDGTNTSWDAIDISTADVSGVLAVVNGGTGQTSYTDGQLLIGNTTGNTLNKATLTASTGISVTNGAGAITITNTAPDQTVSLTGAGATTISGTYPNFTISSVNTTYGVSTTIAFGLIKLGSDSLQGTAANAVTTTASRTYALQLTSAGNAVINVPWTDTTYGTATTTVNGLIKLGDATAQSVAANAVTATASRTYALQLNTSGQAVVNVPWTDTNSGGTVTSVAGTGTVSGLTLSGTVTSSGNITLGGTLAVTPSNFASQAANTVLAAPDGSSGVPTFRALVASDIPTLNQNTTGNAATATTATTVSTTVASGATGTTQAFGTNNTTMATTAFVQAALQLLYPVGTIYSSTVATNPGTLFGFGTWTAYAAGRVLIGDGGGFTAGATGGSADAIVVSHTHTATVTDPGHVHAQVGYVGGTFLYSGGGGSSGIGTPYQASANTASATTGISVSNSTTGSSGTNANLQPYIVVYMWQRTA